MQRSGLTTPERDLMEHNNKPVLTKTHSNMLIHQNG